MNDDWSNIISSDNVNIDNLRRADPNHPLDFWRGRDFRGRYLFILEAASTEDVTPRQEISGIEMVVTPVDSKKLRLTLVLLDSALVELFRALCADLLKATEGIEDPSEGMKIVLDRLKKWQKMLSKRGKNILSSEEMRGLIGELFFLRDLILPALPARAAVNTWRGPYGDEQDFLIKNVIFEIKTQIATADHRIYVSSLDQLDTASGRIVLCHQTISPASSMGPVARTLNGIINEIGAVLTQDNMGAYDIFQLGLLEVGYESRPEYDETAWFLADRNFYDICDDFPKIIPSDVAEGIEEVRYCLRLTGCQKFIINIEQVMKELFHVSA